MTTADLAVGTAVVEHVGKEGLRFSERGSGALSVAFDGQRVWSFVVARDGARSAAGWLVPWPQSLRRFLDGRTEVTVSEVNGRELYRRELSFGAATSRILVVDSAGRPVAIDKTGLLGRLFSAADGASISALLDGVTAVLDVLNDDIGVPAFLTFGALLGAVRDGHLIGHDNDADVSYLATGSDPFDIITESYRIERRFRELGWQSSRLSGADFKLILPWPDGGIVGMDVFTAFYADDDLYVMPNVRAKLPRSTILPISTVQLEGRAVAAPARPEQLLEATYGSGWRVPDPSFQFRTPRATSRRLSGWMRGERRDYRRWDDFYRYQAAEGSVERSGFASWVELRERERGSAGGRLVEVGAGAGSDAFWFARRGFDVIAADFVPRMLRQLRKKANRRGLAVDVRHHNLYDLRDVLTLGAELATVHRPAVVYARLVIDVLAPDGRRNLWRLARMALAGGDGRLYLEFRVKGSVPVPLKRLVRHWPEVDEVLTELTAYGFRTLERVTARGLAVHGDDDPLVCRIVAEVMGSDGTVAATQGASA